LILKKNNEKHQQDQVVFYVTLVGSFFLLTLYLNDTYFKIDHVLVGVFRELGTLPSAGMIPFLVFISAKRFYEKKYSVISYTFLSLLISSITLVSLIIGFSMY